MAQKTEVEKEIGVDLDAENPDIRKGIAAGIKIEDKQALFYSGMEGVLHNHEIIHFFKFLSEEKKLQKGILEKAMKTLEDHGSWIALEYDHGDIENAFHKAGELMGKLRMDAGDVDILSRAVKQEEKTTRFYERMADVLRNEGNDFFRARAEREQRHYDLLVEILDLVKQGKK